MAQTASPSDWTRDFLYRCARFESERGQPPLHQAAVERALAPGDTHLEAKLTLVRTATEATLLFLLAEKASDGSHRKHTGKTLQDLRKAIGQLKETVDQDAWSEVQKGHVRFLQDLGNHASHLNPDLPPETHPVAIAHLGALIRWAWEQVGIGPPPPPPPPKRSKAPWVVGAMGAVAVVALGGWALLTALSDSGPQMVTPAMTVDKPPAAAGPGPKRRPGKQR